MAKKSTAATPVTSPVVGVPEQTELPKQPASMELKNIIFTAVVQAGVAEVMQNQDLFTGNEKAELRLTKKIDQIIELARTFQSRL